jgi:hypothetical protein
MANSPGFREGVTGLDRIELLNSSNGLLFEGCPASHGSRMSSRSALRYVVFGWLVSIPCGALLGASTGVFGEEGRADLAR